MGRKLKKNRNISTIVPIILCIIIVTCCALTIYLYMNDKNKLKEINKIDKNYNDEKETLESKEKKLEELNKELKRINEEINKYKEIDKTIDEVKNTFFKKAKELEDNVLNGKTDKKIIDI